MIVSMRRLLLVLFVELAGGSLAGCGTPPARPEDGGVLDMTLDPPRLVHASGTVGDDGLSGTIDFDVPDGTRGISIEIVGGAHTLYALGSLRTAGGNDLVTLPAGGTIKQILESSFFDDRAAILPGPMYQVVRLGTFTTLYPQSPDQAVPSGRLSLRVAASDSVSGVQVTVRMPADDGAGVVHLNLFTVSELAAAPPIDAALASLRAIYAQAGIEVVVDGMQTLTGSGFSSPTETFSYLPAPDSDLCALAQLGRMRAPTDGIDAFIVDSFAVPGVRGESLGLPGAPDPGSYYDGIFVGRDDDPFVLGRSLAHELGHELALQHVENIGMSGTVYPDPLADTMIGQANLMEPTGGSLLTAGQTYALRRSAFLRTK